jgi:hypothetical protein
MSHIYNQKSENIDFKGLAEVISKLIFSNPPPTKYFDIIINHLYSKQLLNLVLGKTVEVYKIAKMYIEYVIYSPFFLMLKLASNKIDTYLTSRALFVFRISWNFARDISTVFEEIKHLRSRAPDKYVYQIIRINKTQILLKYFFGARGVKFLEKRREYCKRLDDVLIFEKQSFP